MDGTWDIWLIANARYDKGRLVQLLENSRFEADLKFMDHNEPLEEKLAQTPPDLILCEYGFSEEKKAAILEMTRKKDLHLPFIFLADNIKSMEAVGVISRGASDVVMKDHLDRLPLSIAREMHAVSRRRAKEQELSKAEQSLKDTEQKLRVIVEHSTIMFYKHDVNHVLTYVSPQSREFLGYSPEESMKRWTRFLTDHPVNKNGFKKTQRAIETGEAQPPHELELRKKSGEKIWVMVNEAPITKDGKTVSIVGSLSDITQHKRYEEKLEKNVASQQEWQKQLQESINRYETIAKATSDTIWNLDLGTDTMEFNKNIYGMFGYEKGAVEESGQWWRQKIHKKDRTRVIRKIVAALPSGSDRFELEYRFRCADGSYKHIYDRAFIVAGKDGAPKRVIGAMQDVTEQKQEKQWLKLMESAIGTTTESIAITEAVSGDQPGRKILYVNEAFCRMTEYDREEATGRTLHMLNGPRSSKKERASLQRSMDNWQTCEAEFINYKKGGEPFWMHVSMAPVVNSEGQYTHWICVGRDVTERRQRELELQSSLREKETLLLEIHHRVKNNLAVISGMMQLQAFQEKDEDIQHKLYNSVARIQTMASIHELLYQSENFSRLNIGENIKKLVNVIIRTLKVNMDLDLHFELQDIELNINQAIPCSLIINEVVTNALKHAFTEAEEGELTVMISEENDILDLRIKDNGKGLPEDFCMSRKTDSLGLKLIHTLSSQLNAEYSYNSTDEVTIFNLAFKKAEVKGSGSTLIQ